MQIGLLDDGILTKYFAESRLMLKRSCVPSPFVVTDKNFISLIFLAFCEVIFFFAISCGSMFTVSFFCCVSFFGIKRV